MIKYDKYKRLKELFIQWIKKNRPDLNPKRVWFDHMFNRKIVSIYYEELIHKMENNLEIPCEGDYLLSKSQCITKYRGLFHSLLMGDFTVFQSNDLCRELIPNLREKTPNVSTEKKAPPTPKLNPRRLSPSLKQRRLFGDE